MRGKVDVVVAELALGEHPVLDVADAWVSEGDNPRIVVVGDAKAEDRERAARLGIALVAAPKAVRLLRWLRTHA
ncbi:MAG: hypothetical protein ACHREM_10920 [Polyangiales bacterium]